MLRRTSRGLGLVVALLVVGSVLAVIAGGPRADSQASSPSTDTTTQSAAGLGALASGARNPYTWPFSRDSIWNLPVGAGANYVAANITRATGRAMFPDPDVLVLKPNSPITRVWFNKDAWNVLPGPPGRCNPEDKTGDGVPDVLFSAPIPTNFVVYGSNDTRNPHGRTPNYATAILDTDNVTLYQGQPFARCTANGNATIWWFQKNERLDGLGRSGAHGGSMLSSIGGTVRLGELVPGGVIRHAIKVELDGSANYYRIGTDNPNGSRWPATRADWCATHPPSCYGGTVSELRMGSLLALRPAFNITALETEPARILAHALQDYGGYTVDNAGWSVYTIATEFSPDGDVINEFAAKWGFPLGVAANANTNWSRDLHAIFGALHVIKNWNASVWSTVSASNGTQGAGSGAPRVPWAPPFGQAPAKVIGTTTAYNSTLTVYADNKWGNRYTLSEQGSFTKVSGYLDGGGPGSGGEVLRAVIYADSGGVPGALRATTATSTIAHGQAAGWVDFSISPAVTLPPGDYWLTLQAGAVTQGARRYGVAQTGFEKWNLDAFSDGPADPFGTANTGDWRWSLYATYNPSPPPPSPRTIGTTTVYNNTLSVYADNKWGNRYTLSEPGSFTKMSAYLDGLGPGTGGEVLRALIYADSGGIPGALRAASATVTIADGQAARWVDFSISPAVTLQPGDYWLVLQAGAVSQAALRYGVAQTGFEKWNLDAFSDGAANPFGTANTGDWRWSLFATYTPAG